MKTNIFQISIFLFLTLSLASGCSNHQFGTPLEDPHRMQYKSTFFIPFEINENKIILDAMINDVEGNICFEVHRKGIELNTCFFDKLNKSKEALDFINENNIYPSSSYHFKINDFAVDLPSDQSVTVNSEMDSDQTILAFIGRDFFRNSEIAIDYNTKVLTVFTNSKYSPITSLVLIG